MRTSAKNFMLSFALVGGMLCTSSSVAMAQGRHRANSTTSAPRTETRQSAPQSRQSSGSVSTGRERPSATMSQSASQRQERTSTSRADRQERVTAPATRTAERQERAANAATRSTERQERTTNATARSTERQERTTNATTRPDRQVSPAAGSTRTEHRNINSNSSWSNSGNNDRNGSDRGRSGRDGYSDGNSKPGGNNNGNYGSDRGRVGNNYGSDRGRGNNNGNYSNRSGYNNDRGRNGNSSGYRNDGNNRFRPNAGPSRPHNYANHPHRDQFSRNYAHHNWSRPLPPPRRAWRPAYIRYYRPVVPVHYRPYYGAPVIDRILGITFGTLFNVSLDYLYGNGYYIDGYENDMVYLRDVTMLNLLWPDVMLRYDSGRLACAQFAYSTGYNDRSRYNRIYHDLCGVYGPPVSVEAGVATWFGGNTTGWVTLSTNSDYGRFYTTLSIGY